MPNLSELQGMSEIPQEVVREKARVDRLKATEKDVVAAFGDSRVERRFRKDGSYSWRVKFKPNENGRTTKDWNTAWDLLKPWARADVERYANAHGTPGDYGNGLPGKIALPPLSISGDWCSGCDRLKVWCECAGSRKP